MGTLVSYLAMALLNYVFMCRTLEYRPRLLRIFTGPVLSSALMGACAWAVYGLAARVLPGGRMGDLLRLGVAILLAVVVYVVAAIATRSITREDMSLIPGGERIAGLLHMR